MTNETIKILLMVMLLGGLRTALFVTEMPKSWFVGQSLLDWMMAAPVAASARIRSTLPEREVRLGASAARS